ncbi:hypothetical protein J4441_01535 [Candidatus Micrarchaeota archaeon]|nr:hypothetical protein [Candidatus Micrarchaeota archaeon]
MVIIGLQNNGHASNRAAKRGLRAWMVGEDMMFDEDEDIDEDEDEDFDEDWDEEEEE